MFSTPEEIQNYYNSISVFGGIVFQSLKSKTAITFNNLIVLMS